jgi:hypothetical protein
VQLRGSAPNEPEISRSVNELVASRVFTWFNLTGGAGSAVSVRLYGPNMFAVSYGYVIACGGVAAATLGNVGIALLAFCFLTSLGVKGPLLMLIFTLVISGIWRAAPDRRFILILSLGLLVAYVSEGIIMGLSTGDFHVIGLLGGVHGFIKAPWGHGIGVGGNLSADAAEGLDWREWQKTGVDFALESAVGVLLYQMGLAALVVFAPIAAVVRKGLARPAPINWGRRDHASPRPTDVLFVGIAVTLANGFFQEEAYSPYALGLLTLLGGIAISNASAQREDAR